MSAMAASEENRNDREDHRAHEDDRPVHRSRLSLRVVGLSQPHDRSFPPQTTGAEGHIAAGLSDMSNLAPLHGSPTVREVSRCADAAKAIRMTQRRNDIEGEF